ncbi:MAG: class I SAM-dependent methyltransferase [Betaproteobacteria bacterium]|nr:class I SAM-dependent methyltransferase [Betaproteobacteria bacterium]
MQAIHLKPGREKSLLRRHPWVFSGAVDRVQGEPASGGTTDVFSSDGRWLARAAYSPRSQIRARVWTWTRETAIDAGFFRRRIRDALATRPEILTGEGVARRLVHGEADGLPGVVADCYAGIAVLQLTSAGAEHWRDTIVDALASVIGCTQVYERSDVEIRTLEGLAARSGALRGDVPAAPVEINENGVRYLVDVVSGQKTGFYLDQRENRARIRGLAQDRDVMNGFCYTGGFTLAALAGGARSVLSVDSSGPALSIGRQCAALNGFEDDRAAWLESDVFQTLRTLRDQGRRFGLIVLDPPKFAPTAAHAEKASRAYKDINLWALRLLEPNGLLATFSCSGGVGADLFQKIVAGATQDAGVDAQVVERFHAAADHPVVLSFPEGEYLKGLLLRRI